MSASQTSALLGACLLATTLAAQTPGTPPAPTAKAPTAKVDEAAQGTTGRTSLDQHSTPNSRRLFAACDGDNDDRLDLFEASEALETLGDPIDTSGFRTLDTDRDGYVGWSEFDHHFRTVIDRGLTFRVRTCRRFVPTTPGHQAAEAATPLDQFMRLHDTDRDGGLDPEEIEEIGRQLGLLPVFQAELKTLDRDQTGRVEPAEFAPFFEILRAKLTIPGMAAKTTPATASPLPAPWDKVDGNGDGAVDLTELKTALRRIDPGLARWAKYLLERYDRDRDGKLTPDELPQPPADGNGEAVPGTTVAADPGHVGTPSPLA